ncbi:MAG: tRNA-dihydrouridine synthase family protein [Planctomycetia bacterium]|nr:tRNA-dihydrouridine synthase family protein [Planctomycetia bacterium]
MRSFIDRGVPMNVTETLLKPVSLGNVRIAFPCALAALSGYSDQPVRRICRELGAGYTIGEVLLDTFVIQVRRRRAGRYLGVADDEHPVACQIMGNTAGNLAAAAMRAVESGFDVIDLNMGCPVRKVLGKQRGGWLLREPDVAIGMIRRVRDALPPHVPLTVKLRRGTDLSNESEERFFSILEGAIENGVVAVTVHARTVEQKYTGTSDWNFLRRVKDHIAGRIALFGSGDLFCADDVVRMIRDTGVDGVTIARGAIGYPWIFRECAAVLNHNGDPGFMTPAPTLDEQKEIVERLFLYSTEIYGVQKASLMMGRFLLKMAVRAHPRGSDVRDAFIKAGPEQWRNVLKEWY